MSTTLPIKYIKDLETGDRFLPVSSPNAIIWPNGDDLEDKLSDKADKVSSATNGHLASLNSSGNLVDSGIASSNVLTKSNTSGLVRNDGTIDTTEIPTITFIQW